MDWRDEAARDLPRPSPREPRTLRQDILDEVQDHLLLAAEEERAARKDADDDEIRKSVIERFGNPAAVARRLWWDAMKEVIMRDRIIAATVVVVGIAFVVFVAGGWTHLSRRQDALLAAIQEMKQVSARPEYEAILVLHRGSLEGPPAEGVEVSLSHKAGEGPALVIDDKTGADGSVTFRFQNEGKYDITLFDPVSAMTLKKQLTVFAGHGEGEKHIAAPDIGSAELRLQSPLPPQISDDEALLLVELGCEMTVDGAEWRFDKKLFVGRPGTVTEATEVGSGSSQAWGVGCGFLAPVPLRNLQTPDLPVSVLMVSPAVPERLGVGRLRDTFAAPMSAFFAKYPPGKCLLEPGTEAHLIPLEENTLEKWLEVIQYNRAIGMAIDRDWAQLLRGVQGALLHKAQPCMSASVARDEQGNIKVHEDKIAVSDSVVQALEMCGQAEALLIQAQETFEASAGAKRIEILLTWRGSKPAEGPLRVYFVDKESVKQVDVALRQFEETQWGTILLPPEIRTIDAGALFLAAVPGIPPREMLEPSPLFAEFEDIDLTPAKQAMELCPAEKE